MEIDVDIERCKDEMAQMEPERKERLEKALGLYDSTEFTLVKEVTARLIVQIINEV